MRRRGLRHSLPAQGGQRRYGPKPRHLADGQLDRSVPFSLITACDPPDTGEAPRRPEAASIRALSNTLPEAPKTSRMGSNRVLFVSYLFPPVGGAGVQRSLKFVKYLLAHQWLPTVVTVKPISYYVHDASLLNEVPTGVAVVRTESLDPLRVSARVIRGLTRLFNARTASERVPFNTNGRLAAAYRRFRDAILVPDAQIGWIPFAYRAGRTAIDRTQSSVIYATCGPYSSALAAYLLGRRTGLPYVLDFRDGWTDDPYIKAPSRFHRASHRWLEALTVRNAAAVVVYGGWLAERLRDRYPEASPNLAVIFNGYDLSDLEGVVPLRRPTGKVRIVYSGSVYGHHRESMLSFLRCLAGLPEADRGNVEVLFVGQAYEGAEGDIAEAGLKGTVSLCGYMPHADALAWLMSADALLLFVRPGDVSSVTGKVFEYMMVNRPIIGLVEPLGGCADVLRRAGHGRFIVAPNDAPALRRLLLELVHPESRPGWKDFRTSEFSRSHQAGQLAAVFDAVRA